MDCSVKLLVADDEAVMRRFIRQVVEKEALPVSEILEADNGVSAVRLAAGQKPDLALLDIRMPGMNGLEAGSRIIQECPQTRVYIISAYDEFEYARRAFKAGVHDYLVKPVCSAQIVEIVGKASQSRQREQAAPPASVPPLIQAVADFVEANIDQPLPLEKIAKAVFVSPCHLSRKFKSLSGLSITDFIQNKRILKAAQLLSHTKCSITEIAGQTGFANPSYFATRFKAAHGQTPQEYRKGASVKSPE